jgi:hypothetical protein
MALNFPNPSRSYDAARRRIAFWGHDNTLEIPFFLDESAIFRLDPKTKNVEAGMLATFDAAKDRIHQVAGRLHSSAKRTFYVIGTDDFR